MSRQKKGQERINNYNNNGDPFIAKLHNILLEPDLRNRLFSIIMSIHFGHTCLFQKGFCMVYFGEKEKNAVTLPHSAQRKHVFLMKNKGNVKSKEITI